MSKIESEPRTSGCIKRVLVLIFGISAFFGWCGIACGELAKSINLWWGP